MNYDERKFLDSYDPTDYPPMAVAADAVVFGVSKSKAENYRKKEKQSLNVLLVRRNEHPFKNKLALPGGFVRPSEAVGEAADRVLREKTGLEKIYFEQLHTFSGIDRDPRMRVISCAHIALIDAEKARIDGAEWVSLDKINGSELAFDHAEIIAVALNRLRQKITYTDIVFHMMPEKFTISELQEIYEAVLEKKLLPAAFRRTMLDKITETDEFTQNAGHRPSRLYIWNKTGS